MLSQTRRAIEDFDNQHDFERLSADILNALGYQNVEPMAPGGGADGGCDIRFHDDDELGHAFVTLQKEIREKFLRDLVKLGDGEGLIALFCNVKVSPAQKRAFTKEALEHGYQLVVFDIERLRSLLDNTLKDIRRRYLGIDDEPAAQIRSRVRKLLRFPDAVPDDTRPATFLESLLQDQLSRRLFDLLMNHDERLVQEMPLIGPDLHKFMISYYKFRTSLGDFENGLFVAVGKRSKSPVPASWRIYVKYCLMRFAGESPEEIRDSGLFLNYGITWEGAERMFADISGDPTFATPIADLLKFLEGLATEVGLLITKVATDAA